MLVSLQRASSIKKLVQLAFEANSKKRVLFVIIHSPLCISVSVKPAGGESRQKIFSHIECFFFKKAKTKKKRF